MRRLQQTRFECRGGMIAWIVCVFGGAFVGGTAVLAVVAWSHGATWASALTWVLLAAAAFSCVLVAAAVTVLRRWRLYGSSTLEVARYPDDSSPTFAGTIIAAGAVAKQRRIVLTLCEKRMTLRRSRGREDRTEEQTVWKLSRQVDAGRLGRQGERCLIPFELELPEGPRPDESHADSASARTFWTLEVQATGPLPKYHAFFTLSDSGAFIRLG
jgi:hypothetical protein